MDPESFDQVCQEDVVLFTQCLDEIETSCNRIAPSAFPALEILQILHLEE